MTATKPVAKKTVREVKSLRTSARPQAGKLHHCCRCCR